MDAVKEIYFALAPLLLPFCATAIAALVGLAFKLTCKMASMKVELDAANGKLAERHVSQQYPGVSQPAPQDNKLTGQNTHKPNESENLPDGCKQVLISLASHDGVPDSAIVENTGVSLIAVQHSLGILKSGEYVTRKHPRQNIVGNRAVQPPDTWHLAQRGLSYLIEHKLA